MALNLDRQNAYREQYRRLHPTWRPATEVYETLIRELMRPGMFILDIGCGRGGVLEQIRQVGDDAYSTFGFDPDLASLREHRLPDLKRAQALAEALPMPDYSIDLAVSSWVFEHLAAPERTFAAVARILRTGGSWVFITPNANSLVARLNQTLRPLQRLLVPRLYGRAEIDTFPVCYRANTRARLMRLADGAGLRFERLVAIEDPTYLAFTPWLYRLSTVLSLATPPVHLVGRMVKE